MTSRERIKKTLDHKETPKTPIDFGGTNISSIAAVAYSRLLEEAGIMGRRPRIYDFGQQLVLPDKDIMGLLGTDLIEPGQGFLESDGDWRTFTVAYDGKEYLIPRFIDDIVDLEEDENNNVYIKDKDGTILGKMPSSAVHFNQSFWPYAGPEGIPLQFDKNLDSKHQWAIPNIPNNIDINSTEGRSTLRNKLKKIYNETDYAIVYPVGGSTIIAGSTLRGLDNFLCDIYQDRQGTLRLLQHLAENHLRFIDNTITAAGDFVEAFLFYDDFGHQEAAFIPVELYRDIFKPVHKKMWDLIHNNSRCKVMLHCCGSVYELIPDLIEAGIDILNPVQTNAKNMEPEKLKKEFGRDLTFWGGGCDPKTLAQGSKEDVRNEVRKRLDIFLKNGGYVFAPILNITAEVPAANIITMYKTAMEY
jgi:uroporphyrinogen decarboxylase